MGIRKIFSGTIILFILVVLQPSFAQIDNSHLYEKYPLGLQYRKNLYADIDILGYARNNEYFGKTVSGYTLFGYQFKPEVCFYPLENIRLGLGGFFQRDFGDDGIQYTIPVFSITYRTDSLKIIFGTLEGTLTHQIIEPLFGFERVITDRIEEGFQVKWYRRAFYLDTWLDWQNMIRKGDEELEEFIYGLRFKPVLFRKRNMIFELDWQMILRHRGGQIDNTNLEEVLVGSSAVGFSFTTDFPQAGLISQIRSDNYYLLTKGSENAFVIDFNNGYGIYLNVNITMRNFQVMGSYWYADDFIAPAGGEIYQSISINYPEEGYYEKIRQLLFLRCMWQKEIGGGLSLGIRYEPFYDFVNNAFDSSQGLYLRYRGDFKITSLDR